VAATPADVPVPAQRPPDQFLRGPDPFQRRLASASALTVDIGHFRNVSVYLNTLAAAVRGEVADVARRADQSLRAGRYEQSYFGSDEIRDEVPRLSQQTRKVHQDVDDNLADIAKALEQTAKAIDRIAKRYTVDQLRQLRPVDVTRLLPPSGTSSHGR
jgi:hypothetical protein